MPLSSGHPAKGVARTKKPGQGHMHSCKVTAHCVPRQTKHRHSAVEERQTIHVQRDGTSTASTSGRTYQAEVFLLRPSLKHSVCSKGRVLVVCATANTAAATHLGAFVSLAAALPTEEDNPGLNSRLPDPHQRLRKEDVFTGLQNDSSKFAGPELRIDSSSAMLNGHNPRTSATDMAVGPRAQQHLPMLSADVQDGYASHAAVKTATPGAKLRPHPPLLISHGTLSSQDGSTEDTGMQTTPSHWQPAPPLQPGCTVNGMNGCHVELPGHGMAPVGWSTAALQDHQQEQQQQVEEEATEQSAAHQLQQLLQLQDQQHDGSRGIPALDAPHLTVHIRNTRHWHHVEKLLLEQGPNMNSRHVATMLYQLALLHGTRSRNTDREDRSTGHISPMCIPFHDMSRVQRVGLSKLVAKLSDLSLRCLELGLWTPWDQSNGIWALAKLGYLPSSRWTSSFLATSLPLLPEYSPEQLSSTLWALATLQLDPGSQWLAVARSRALELASSGRLAPQALAICFWAVACIAADSSVQAGSSNSGVSSSRGRVDGRVNGSSLQDPLESSYDEDAHSLQAGWGMDSIDQQEISSQELSNAPSVSRGGNQHQSQPGQRHDSTWLDAFLGELVPSLPRFEPHYVSMVVYSLALLRHQPEAPVMSALMDAVFTRLDVLGPQSLSNILWATAGLPVSLQPDRIQQLMARAVDSCHLMSSQQLANTAWALARLQVQPPPELLQKLLSAAYPLLYDMEPQGLSNLIWALARCGFRPSPTWMDSFTKVSREKLGLMGPQSLANLLWAVAALGYHPTSAWWTAFLARSARVLPAMSASGLAACGTALGRLGHVPSPDWLSAYLQATQAVLPAVAPTGASSKAGGGSSGSASTLQQSSSSSSSSTEAASSRAQELGNTTWALAKLGVQPSQAWMEAAEAAAGALLPHMAPQNVVNVLYGFARMRYAVSGSLVERAIQHLLQAAGSLSVLHISNLLWSLAMLDYVPEESVVVELARAAGTRMAEAGHRELAQIVFGLSRIGYTPDPGLLELVVEVAEPQLPGMPLLSLMTILRGLVQWEHQPSAQWLRVAAAAVEEGRQAQVALPAAVLASTAPSNRVVGKKAQRRAVAAAARLPERLRIRAYEASQRALVQLGHGSSGEESEGAGLGVEGVGLGGVVFDHDGMYTEHELRYMPW